jgi:2-polyprenyl-6-methoxyphenol hydroxylase-like FAD-dependent oxidoreductase
VQEEDFVTAIFENGQFAKGSFAVGCDGLHSKTRAVLFGNETAEYTGLTQVRICVRALSHPQKRQKKLIHVSG